MSLNVAFNQNFNKGIDSTALRSVTKEIFTRAESKTADLSKMDLTKFKRADIGMDLYSGKVDAKTAKQVAMSNSGMQVSLNEQAASSLKFLNAQAAQKMVSKNVEGKIGFAVSEEAPKAQKNELPSFNGLVKTSDLSQDKRGSNPFHKGLIKRIQKAEESEENTKVNIFA